MPHNSPADTTPAEDIPANEALRRSGDVIDQRQQQIDPAGHHRIDRNAQGAASQKQPGSSQDSPAPDAPSPAAKRDG